jgi:TRAP-type C4-dicarboxylate transport system permease large subunit
MVKRNPGLAPANLEPVSWREKFLALKNVWEIILAFLVVMGGIYLGWFTPSEAGAAGATLLFFIAFLKKKLTFKNLFAALQEAVRVSAMVLFLIAGATVYTYFLGLSTIPMKLVEWVAGLTVSPYLILCRHPSCLSLFRLYYRRGVNDDFDTSGSLSPDLAIRL